MVLTKVNQLIYLVITNEVDKKNAYKIANLLLEEKLIPCVTFKNIESNFWWKGEINKSKEVQLIIKCKEENLNTVCKKISESHSYELPEIIYFPVLASKEYHHWVNSF
tara:strand:+ start:755 stop:1078 length:324 start_codon:yes stop_codon:yes gene_type:complete